MRLKTVNKHKGKRVLVFGTFDKIHDGHIFFLREAQKLGDELFVSIARDKNIKLFKNKDPLLPEKERLVEVEALSLAKEVFLGDEVIGTWTHIRRLEPHIIAVGYDQRELGIALENIKKDFTFEIVRIRSHLPETFHSSILNNL